MKNGNWKADEMEMAINFRAMRCGWVFLVLSLAVWCIVEVISTGKIPIIPFALECISIIVFFSAKLWITKRMTLSKREDNEE